MDLHQIQVTYQLEDDRVLVRAAFNERDGKPHEIRAWLTRRFVKNLWPGIIRSLETQVTLNQPQVAHARTEIVGMEYQAALSEIKAQGSFDTPFEPAAQIYPLGEMPILVNTAHFTLNANQPLRINFVSAQKSGFELAFTPIVLHGFCTLLQQAVKAAEWEMDLQLPGAPLSEPGPRVLN